MNEARKKSRALAILCLTEFLGMSVWFSASAVVPALAAAWSLSASGQAWLTMSVQLGFVAGALGSAVLNLADRIPEGLYSPHPRCWLECRPFSSRRPPTAFFRLSSCDS